MKTLKRSLITLCLLVFLCPLFQGCTRDTNVSNIEASFDSNTITVSSPKDNTFILNIKMESNSQKKSSCSCTSGNLSITGGVPQTYNLKTLPLMPKDFSEDSHIVSVEVKPATIDDLHTGIWVIAFSCFFGGLLLGFFLFKDKYK